MDSLNFVPLLTFYERFFFALNLNVWQSSYRYPRFRVHPMLVIAFGVGFVCAVPILLQFVDNQGLSFLENNARCFYYLSECLACGVSLIEFARKRQQIEEFWCKTSELNNFIYRKLGYRIPLKRFLEKFLLHIVVVAATTVAFILSRTLYPIEDLSLLACYAVMFSRILLIYISTNVLFFIDLFEYFNRLLAKYIKCNYLQRESNVLFADSKCSILSDLRTYKQIHFSLHEIALQINQIFGLICMVLLYSGLVSASHNVFFGFRHLMHAEDKFLLSRNALNASVPPRNGQWPVSGDDFADNSIYVFVFPFAGPICNFLSAVISTTILINACHYCTVQVRVA